MSTTLQKTQPQAPSNPTTAVQQMVQRFVAAGTLRLPPNYSPENALKSAWLVLQETTDKERRPVLESCTRESLTSALLDTVVQGLNPGKKQCYYIAYGKKLICQRSYFGDIALVERINPSIQLYYDVVYEGEAFSIGKTFSTRSGLITTITKHEQSLPRSGAIVGAYCGAVDTSTGENLGVVVMDMDQIKKSWNQGQTKGQSDAHKNFPDQMALRTVIRRFCKPLINKANDEMLIESIRRSDEDAIEAQAEEEASTHANGEVLSLPAETVAATPEPEPEPAKAAEPVAPAQASDDEYDPFKVD